MSGLIKTTNVMTSLGKSTANIFQLNIFLIKFLMKTDKLMPHVKPSGYCNIFSEILSLRSVPTQCVCVPHGSHNNQRLFSLTALTDWLCSGDVMCFLWSTNRNYILSTVGNSVDWSHSGAVMYHSRYVEPRDGAASVIFSPQQEAVACFRCIENKVTVVKGSFLGAAEIGIVAVWAAWKFQVLPKIRQIGYRIVSDDQASARRRSLGP
jgi:hypothetical protein